MVKGRIGEGCMNLTNLNIACVYDRWHGKPHSAGCADLQLCHEAILGALPFHCGLGDLGQVA